MEDTRPYCLTLAGLDPSAGAGLAADIKTFECLCAYGFAACTALTYQNDSQFLGVKWVPLADIFDQLNPIKSFPVRAIKIGLIRSLADLLEIASYLREAWPNAVILWDPIVAASAGFTFLEAFPQTELEACGRLLSLITPNSVEILKLTGCSDLDHAILELKKICNFLLKGGHQKGPESVDRLFWNGKHYELKQPRVKGYDKRGTGCILSAAICAGLAKGLPMEEAALMAQKYVITLLKSNQTLLGYHNQDD